MPYFSNELTNGGPRKATAGDLFNQDKVHLIHYGFGKYTFAYGDSPQTAIAEVRSKDGQLVIFDVTKIYKDINKFAQDFSLRKKDFDTAMSVIETLNKNQLQKTKKAVCNEIKCFVENTG